MMMCQLGGASPGRSPWSPSSAWSHSPSGAGLGWRPAGAVYEDAVLDRQKPSTLCRPAPRCFSGRGVVSTDRNAGHACAACPQAGPRSRPGNPSHGAFVPSAATIVGRFNIRGFLFPSGGAIPIEDPGPRRNTPLGLSAKRWRPWNHASVAPGPRPQISLGRSSLDRLFFRRRRPPGAPHARTPRISVQETMEKVLAPAARSCAGTTTSLPLN